MDGHPPVNMVSFLRMRGVGRRVIHFVWREAAVTARSARSISIIIVVELPNIVNIISVARRSGARGFRGVKIQLGSGRNWTRNERSSNEG